MLYVSSIWSVPMSPLEAFLAKCDAACAALKMDRTALSNLLLFDSRRLDLLAAGKDIGVRRLEEADADLVSFLADPKAFRQRRRAEAANRKAEAA